MKRSIEAIGAVESCCGQVYIELKVISEVVERQHHAFRGVSTSRISDGAAHSRVQTHAPSIFSHLQV